ncbi:MAG: orotate phosphoribosyltransferase [Actinobacteria bacterium]|nr:MAG: orotate phosphoribosyltransferase [Actinomycetota bacterium]
MVPKPHKSSQYKAAGRSAAMAGPSRLAKILNEDQVLQALRDVGAISNGHFILSSGRHSDVYAEKFRALEHPGLAVSLGASLADRFADQHIDVVLSPAVGAIVLGFATALAVSRNRNGDGDGEARFIFAERDAGAMRLRRGFEVAPGERVLVVEDVVTTGASLREVLALVDPDALVGVGCLLDRSSGLDLGLPLTSLARLQAPTWDPAECPLCAEGLGAAAPGSRHLTASSG